MDNGKEIVHDSTTMGLVEVIAGGFARGGLNSNARNRHLRVVMIIDNKKVKPDDVGKSAVISFSNNNYLKGFNQTTMNQW